MSIYFNAKSKEYYELSNLYGGVEFDYVMRRFNSPNIKALLKYLKTLRYSSDIKEFTKWLKLLQPDKKLTTKMVTFWIHGKTPIPGILAKLIGGCYDGKSRTARQRIQAVCKEMPGIHPEMFADTRVNTMDDMIECLRIKYLKTSTYYKKVLLKTGNKRLHELPLKGDPGKWTYMNGKGGDLLGKMLMKIRDELKVMESPPLPGPIRDDTPKELTEVEWKVHYEIDDLREKKSGYDADEEGVCESSSDEQE